jgi:hypothetical protein
MNINEQLNVCATHYPTFDFYCCYKKQGCFIIEKNKKNKKTKKKKQK